VIIIYDLNKEAGEEQPPTLTGDERRHCWCGGGSYASQIASYSLVFHFSQNRQNWV